MVVPDDFGFFLFGVVHMNFTVHMIFFDLHHSGTQSFLGNIDIVFDPKIRQLYSPGGVSTPKAKKIALFNVHKKSSHCADVRFNVRRKAVSVRTLNI